MKRAETYVPRKLIQPRLPLDVAVEIDDGFFDAGVIERLHDGRR